jgi:xanthine dehydrogenase YagT iron-sulfur-binding subunit
MSEKKSRKSKGISRREFLKSASAAVVASGAGASLLHCTTKATEADSKPQAPEGTVPVTLRVNGKTYSLHLEPRVTLLDALRERLQITGPKRVCDRGNCGCCTVLKDGLPIYACLMLAVDAQGSEIVTVEGLGSPEKMSLVQQKFVEKDALMCGFCTPGFVVAVHALIQKNPKATKEEIREALRGNICRCGTFNRVFEAAYEAVQEMGRSSR